MSMQQAFQQTITYCQAGKWSEAETLYQAIVQLQPSTLDAQYWLGYIAALIQNGKPRTTASAPPPALPKAAVPAVPRLSLAIAAAIKVARPPNPCYTARLPRYPLKMAIGNSHVPSRRQMHQLLGHYQRARHDEAETLARELIRQYPLHDLGWKVLVTTLQLQGRSAEAQQAQAQRHLHRNAVRRKNVRPASAEPAI